MDTVSSVKMTAIAATQYASNANENTKAQLLRHTEVLLALLKTKEVNAFLKNSEVSKDCVKSLTDVLANCNKNKEAMCTIFKLFSAIYDLPYAQKLLFEHIDINALLMKYIVEHMEYESIDSMQECLDLLQQTTLRCKLCDMSCYVDKFLQCLLKEILKDSSKHATVCLGILNNLVSNNIVVQAQVKGMLSSSNLKQLMNYLRQESIPNKISFLSIVTFICWDDDLAKKFFSIKNVTQTMKLLFSQLVAADDLTTQQRAGDICIELLTHDDIAQQISIYDSEHSIVSKLLIHLQKDLHQLAVAKLLEVLIAFCQISTIRHRLCLTMLESEISWQSLFKIALNPMAKTVEEPSILSLMLIAELCEEMNDSNIVISDCSWFLHLLSILVKQLVPVACDSDDFFSAMMTNSELKKKLQAVQILKMFAIDEKLAVSLAKNLDHESLCKLLDGQMSKNVLEVTRLMFLESAHLSSGVVLHVLDLVRNLKSYNGELEKLLYAKLQDARIIPFLAKAMTSSDRSQLQSALKLHQEALPLPSFPCIQLAEMMGFLNERRKTSDDIPTSFSRVDGSRVSTGLAKGDGVLQQSKNHNSENKSSHKKKSVSLKSNSMHSEEKENIQKLIASMQTCDDDDDESTKDFSHQSKTSEIVTIYENKLSSLLTSKNHLQDLLEAKTLALSQADRIINQHRFQLAKSEEDARKMADILKASESCCERLTETVKATECDRTSMERDLQTVVEENRNLQKVADQYDKMQVAFQDNMHKSEVLERNLKTSRQEYDTLKELHDMIQRHNEKLKQQHNQMTERLEEVEEERMKLLKRVSDLETSVSDLTQLVEEQDRAAQVLMQEKVERDTHIKTMKSQIGKLDEQNKDLKIKESQLSCCVLEKDEELSNLKQTLEKQAQTLSMITELANSKHRRPR